MADSVKITCIDPMRPIVSVIIPTFNVETYISQTINGIVSQTFTDIEVIVVDDGSTDQTRSIVASYGHKVRLIEQENRGVCAARNRGLREARGEFICFSDHDDYWFPHKLSRQMAEMKADESVGVVYSEFIRWEPSDAGEFANPSEFDLSGWTDEIDDEFSGWIYHKLLLDCWVLTSTAMLRASVLQACGAFDERLPYSEDWDLWIRISRNYKFKKLRRPTTLYRQHPAQGSRARRTIDYRTTLLAGAYAKWGLASPDGTAIPKRAFIRQLAKYHLSFGFARLKQNELLAAQHSFLRAWLINPINPRPLGFMILSNLGWRPRW